jgi:hypothetical protein
MKLKNYNMYYACILPQFQLNFNELISKWKGFGWNTISCDGHNISELLVSLKKEMPISLQPLLQKRQKVKEFLLWRIIMIGIILF